MKGKFNFKLGALCAILSAMLLMPALGQAKGEEAAVQKDKKDGQMSQRTEAQLLKKRRQFWQWQISMRKSAKTSSTA